MLGLSQMAVLGLLTSGQLEGHQDERARWLIPSTAVDTARHGMNAGNSVSPLAEETPMMPASPTNNQARPVSEESVETHGEVAADPPEQIAALPNDSGWVTTEVAAAALRVSPRTVRDYINSGELKAKHEGEGVRKRWLVSIDAVQALRDKRNASGEIPRNRRDTAVGDLIAAANAVDLGDLVATIRELEHRLGRAEARAELTERTESSLREDLEREREERQQAREEAERLRSELEAERSKGFWRRLFGG